METEEAIEEVIRENESNWIADYHDGEPGALNFAVGQVVEKTGGTVDPHKAHSELVDTLGQR